MIEKVEEKLDSQHLKMKTIKKNIASTSSSRIGGGEEEGRKIKKEEEEVK